VKKRPVTLSWEGKSDALRSLRLPVPPLVVEEICAMRADDAAAPHRLVRGDALDTARALEREGVAGEVDLVYLDPPYASGVDYRHEERLDGRALGRVARAEAYRDRWDDGAASHLDMLFPRLAAIRPLMKPSASIWIQVDWRASYLVRALCDEIFGPDRFLNEIVWRRAPNLGRQARSGQFGRTLDTIVVYGAGPKARLVPPERLVPVPTRAAKHDAASDRWFTLAPRGDYTDASIARLAEENRVYTSSSGMVSIKYWLERDDEGQLCKRQPVDALWTDIPPLRHAASEERTGYPTQKPRRLLERILLAGSPPGGLVVDLFAGSGTTGAAAARLGRRFVLGDESPVAIATMRSRLLREGVSPLVLESCGRDPEGELAEIAVRPRGDAHVEVTLACAAGAEPVAWSVDLEPEQGRPFRAAWHAERGTGRRPAPLARVAILPRSARVQARVYFVDGKVATASASCATANLHEPTTLLEAPT
jgi:DNA modification methylase